MYYYITYAQHHNDVCLLHNICKKRDIPEMCSKAVVINPCRKTELARGKYIIIIFIYTHSLSREKNIFSIIIFSGSAFCNRTNKIEKCLCFKQ